MLKRIMPFEINLPVPVVLHRYRKNLSTVLYVAILAFCAYVIYDPESVMSLVLPAADAPAVQQLHQKVGFFLTFWT